MSSKVAARQCSRVERPAAASPPFRRSVVPPLRRRWVIRFALTMTVLITLAPASAETQRGRADVREGNRLYGERRYAEAHERYLDALRDAPDSPLIRFNDGNALYQTQEFQRALEAYRDAIESGDATLVSDSWYNLGNVLYRQQKLQEALEAYKEALRHDPSDIDAKHNLERVLQQLQQQQQQQQQQQGQDDQQQDEQEQQQQEQQQQQQDQRQEEQEQDQQQQEQQQEQQAQPQQSEMSREEAERLLQAIQEDPDKIQRQRASPSRRRPRKDW